MDEYIEEFLVHLLKIKNFSQHTLRAYSQDLGLFSEYAKEISFEKIGRREIRGFLAFLQKRGEVRKTQLRRISALRSFFAFLVERGVKNGTPFDEMEPMRREKALPKAVEFEEVMKFFAAARLENFTGLRDRAIMEVLYGSGLRVSELVALNLSDIDFSMRLLHVKGKGKKERVVPFTKSSMGYLQRYLDHPSRIPRDVKAVFLNKSGERLTVRSIDRMFEKYGKSALGEQKITPHTLRHSIATHLLEGGMDLKTIQELLGHASLSTTTLYTKVTGAYLREVYENAHPLAVQKEQGKL